MNHLPPHPPSISLMVKMLLSRLANSMKLHPIPRGDTKKVPCNHICQKMIANLPNMFPFDARIPPHADGTTLLPNNWKEDKKDPNEPAAPEQKLSIADSALLFTNTRCWRMGRRGRGRGKYLNRLSSSYPHVMKSTKPTTTSGDTPKHH